MGGAGAGGSREAGFGGGGAGGVVVGVTVLVVGTVGFGESERMQNIILVKFTLKQRLALCVQYTVRVHWDNLHSIMIFNPNLTQEGMGAYSRNPHTASTSLQRLTVSEIEIINVQRQSKAHHHHPLEWAIPCYF